jgi:hypothetical protein
MEPAGRQHPFDFGGFDDGFDGFGSPLPTEADFVEATIAFLNGDSIRVGEPSDKALSVIRDSVAVGERFSKLLREAGLLEDAGHGCSPVTTDLQSRYRAAARDLLSAYLRDPIATGKLWIENGMAIGLDNMTVLRGTERGLEIVHHYSASTILDVISVGKALLLDRGKGFVEGLCQCRLGSCGKFFFAKKPATGRPATRYCSRKHMLSAHDKNAPARKRRAKARRKK